MPPTATSTAINGSKRSKSGISTPESESNAKNDFFWTYTEEPHRTRRMAIIKKHPEVSGGQQAPMYPFLAPINR